jgi:hypothetical protein
MKVRPPGKDRPVSDGLEGVALRWLPHVSGLLAKLVHRQAKMSKNTTGARTARPDESRATVRS